jgi:uncharacterized protein YyaL (SSP411 family)
MCLTLLASTGHAENRLAGESSLYLQQHADQPIDWYPWGDEALAKARSDGKLIFVSVGYAACHWCHVMAEESFDNHAIAAQLNAGFISIKIDRERRPDLDEQFNLVSTMLSGSSGWPNSVVMTPDGEPFFAGGYFPPDQFARVLTAARDAWRDDRPQVAAFAFETAARIRTYLDQAAVLGEVTSTDISAAAHAMITDLDAFNGGFGTAPKFPRESFLLHLLDQAARHGDGALLHAVTLTLDGMIRGGVHDQIGGGFHRYAIDPEWAIPHFEKMLYTQALMGRVLLRAYGLTGNPDYARAATRSFDYVLRDMRAPGGAFYAAQDADSILPSGEREEGRFYVWTPEEVAAALGNAAAPMAAALNIEAQGAFEGRSIPSLGQSATETAAYLGLPIATFDAHLDTLRRSRAKRAAPIRDEKIILSWNAEMIATLAEAASVLDRPDYLAAAAGAARFLLENLRTDAGLKRIHYNGQADTDAQLPDIAALGNALLALYDHGARGDWLAQAEPLALTLRNGFTDAGQALRMTATATGLGPFRPLDDTELASGNALALAFLAGLDRRLARSGDAAPNLAAAIAIDAINLPGQRAGLLSALEQSRFGPSGPMRVSSGGAVHVLARADRTAGEIHLDIRLRDGWHINAHEPLEDYLIGMTLTVNDADLPASQFPDPVIRRLGFSAAPLALYETGFRLSAPLSFRENLPAKATLTLQACNHDQCLPPDDMVVFVWPDSNIDPDTQ